MPNRRLDQPATQQIRDAMRGRSCARATAEPQRLAALYHCSVNCIYELSRAVRPPRKVRADKGRRAADLLADDALLFTTARIVLDNLTPEDAVETANANNKPLPVSFATLRRYLRDHG